MDSKDFIELLAPNKTGSKILYHLQIIKNLLEKYSEVSSTLKPTAKLYLNRQKVINNSTFKDEFPQLGAE